MPRNVRNSWIDCQIDGRESTLSGGPRSKDGAMDAQLYVREDGGIAPKPYRISVRPHGDTIRVVITRGDDTLCNDTYAR